ncbi:Gfo/Idh/MocA family protein [Qipengyuania flava]|jgi:predicted dehydrogenase|uniref:Gfo/Idh/MocA family protein n=1 Tax=Qipengyuania flava TaxID=192812 RepID=UPI001C57EC5C|nr:Gfo/Idh/MocA family oxidoreductase [Qipengyuania flava]MBW3168695.1 Gfo/Idh/MocA family oxidoreductase [Qipengyuania flava]MBY5965933.1 Gfo/Idh/MocA family oxidoreductase [Qipengyuania flava]MBY6012257.1 Gfo/Idh/MocA family oxidoreductase [Qipengyuania flava]MBY6026699.1 Gfo/Idh/MocA family oxidoreductase [Qipengyuania flava]
MRALIQKAIARGTREARARGILRVRKDANCLNWAIVGTGYMASVWADLLLASNTGRLHAVCSRSPEKAAGFGRKFGCKRGFGDLAQMLSEEGAGLDFVYVATPLETHRDIIENCIAAGVNVLTEKPATPTSEKWAELAAMAKERGVLLIEGMWMLCLPTFGQADDWIAEGAIGEVQSVEANLNKYQPQSETGVLMDYGVYALAFARHFLGGTPDQVSSHGRNAPEGHDTAWEIDAARAGRTATIKLSANSHEPSIARVTGTGGSIEWASPFNRASAVTLRRLGSGGEEVRRFAYRHQGFEYQLAEATRCQRLGMEESPLISHSITRDTLRFAEQVRAGADRDGPRTSRTNGG